MKDILFSAKQQKTELKWLCACLITAFLVNVAAILVYKTEWKELWTQLVRVFILGCGLYAVSVVIRLIVYAIKKAIHRA